MQSGWKPPGVFKSPNDVRDYERVWHMEIYDTSMNGLKEKVCSSGCILYAFGVYAVPSLLLGAGGAAGRQ